MEDIDFGSAAGLQALLAVVRSTPLDRGTYNHVRDLIFSYKQQGDAPAIKTEIVSILTEVGLIESSEVAKNSEGAAEQQVLTDTTDTAPETEAVPAAVVSRARPLPSFGSVATAAADYDKENTTEVVATTKSTVTDALTETTEKATSSTLIKSVTRAQQPGVMIPKNDVAAKVDVTADSATESVDTTVTKSDSGTEPKPLLDSVVSQGDSTPDGVRSGQQAAVAEIEESVDAIESEPAAAYDGDPLERIKAIKHEVNEKVGNPINLIDADNDVGREYMNALLDAMKKINGGTSAEVVVAMQRLEDSYVAVKTVIENGGVKPEPATPAAGTVATPVPEPAEPTPVESVSAIVSEPAVAPIAPEAETATSVVAAPIAGQSAVTADIVPSVTPLQSVADQKQTAEANREALTADARAEQAIKEAAIAAMDPLEVPDVTNGLNQLLSEWNLFKSSGIFGTGPRGLEHPLYIELAPLMMSAIIAGRFESATPDVKQSIADYMNGWRYEESIVHEHTETFEHYLRRVVRTILDKQPNKKA